MSILEIEASQPEEYTLCPWKRMDEQDLSVDVCIRMKDHAGAHDYRPAGPVTNPHRSQA